MRIIRSESVAVNGERIRRVVNPLELLFVLIWTATTSAQIGIPQNVDVVTTGTLARQLEQPVEITWVHAPLRASLRRLADAQGITVYIDRRIDPDQLLTLSLTGTLEEGLRELARTKGWHISVLSTVVYLGPNDTTAKLATLIELNRRLMRRLPATARRPWHRREPANWPRLTEPRQLISTWAQESGIRLNGVDKVPHDLWPEYQLPPLSLLERLTLVLAGFDLTIRVNGDGSADVISIPQRVVISRQYTLTDRQLARLSELKSQCPTASFQTRGNRMAVVGRSEDHATVADWLRGRPQRRQVDRPGKRVFSLNVVNQPLEGVLRSLAEQLKLDLELRDLSDEQRRQRVTLQIRNATLAELLAKIVGPTGMDFQLDGDKLIILRR